MDFGLYKDIVYLRDMTFNQFDIEFTYNLLIKRLQNNNTLIALITDPTIPSLEQHSINLREKFKFLKIMMIRDIPVGFLTIDNKNFLGFFYNNYNLKHALKKCKENSINVSNMDLTQYFLNLAFKSLAKGETVFAYINPNHTISNNTCKKTFKHIANLYGVTNE